MEQRAHLIPTFIHTFHIRLQLDLFILFILDYNQIYSYISYQTTTRFIHTFHISHTSQHLNQIRTIHSLAQIRFELVIPWLRLDQNQSFLGLDQIRTSHSLAQIRLELVISKIRLELVIFKIRLELVILQIRLELVILQIRLELVILRLEQDQFSVKQTYYSFCR